MPVKDAQVNPQRQQHERDERSPKDRRKCREHFVVPNANPKALFESLPLENGDTQLDCLLVEPFQLAACPNKLGGQDHEAETEWVWPPLLRTNWEEYFPSGPFSKPPSRLAGTERRSERSIAPKRYYRYSQDEDKLHHLSYWIGLASSLPGSIRI